MEPNAHQLFQHELEVGEVMRVRREEGVFASIMGLISIQAKSLSLGGGTPTIHSSTYHILSDLCISIFRFLLFLFLFSFCFCFCFHLRFCFYFPKHKKSKNIFVVSLGLLLQFLSFSLLCFLVEFCYSKIQKDFALFALSIENPKIFVVLLWFCKVWFRVQRSSRNSIGAWFSFHIIQATSEIAIMTIMTIQEVVRGWYELYLFSFLYIYSFIWTCLACLCKVYVT